MILEKEVQDFWSKHDPVENKKAEMFLNLMIENRKSAQANYMRFFYILIILCTCFFLINSNQVKDISVLTLTLQNQILLKWILMTLSSFVLYMAVSYITSEYYYRVVIESFFEKHLPDLDKLKLKALYSGPSFVNFERFVAEVYSGNKDLVNKLTIYFFSFLVLLFLTTPIFCIIYFIISNISDFNKVGYFVLKLIAIMTSIIFLVRAIWLFKLSVSY